MLVKSNELFAGEGVHRVEDAREGDVSDQAYFEAGEEGCGALLNIYLLEGITDPSILIETNDLESGLDYNNWI